MDVVLLSSWNGLRICCAPVQLFFLQLEVFYIDFGEEKKKKTKGAEVAENIYSKGTQATEKNF